MDSGFQKRLSEFRKDKGFSQDELGTKIGKKRGAIGSYERGIAEPSIENIMHICEVLEVTPNDLLLDESKVTAVSESGAPYGRVIANATRVNIKANAGNGVESQEREEILHEYWSMLPQKSPRGNKWMIFQVDGDSMRETISDGDFIACEKCEDIADDLIYMVRFADGSLSCKQLRKNRDRDSNHYNKIEMISHNHLFRNQWVSREEIVECWRVYFVVGLRKM